MTRVLERLGHTVAFPREQTCCGQMHYNTGYHAKPCRWCVALSILFRDAEAVCVPSASCVAMMREHYEMIAEAEKDAGFLAEVRSLLPRVFEFSELLVHRLGVEDVGAAFTTRVTYHPSCHSLRMLHVGDAPLRLLRSVRDLTYIELAGQGAVLRLRRHLRRQKRRRFGRHARRKRRLRAARPTPKSSRRSTTPA